MDSNQKKKVQCNLRLVCGRLQVVGFDRVHVRVFHAPVKNRLRKPDPFVFLLMM
jgi:hypothetical protein